MTDRVVRVTVTAAVSSYLAGMDLVAKKSREGRTEAEALTAKLEAQQKAFNIAGGTMLAAGGLVAAGLALATKKAADFDQAMSNVAATGKDARDNIAALTKASMDAGAATVFSATEAAGAVENLEKAGLNAKDILSGGLTGALSLAAAGGLQVADAAEIAATTLKEFGLQGDKATHVADLLSAGAGKAVGDVSDIALALKQSGLVANQFGISVEQTTAALAAFADKGLLGSDAGTSFKTMLLALAKPSSQATDLMKELGIKAYDASGSFVGLEKFAGNLKTSLGKLTDEQRQSALATIFGTDAVRSATVLYDEGAKGIADWTSKVNDSGYAAKTAATRMDNLKGDLENLSGSFDSALISIGESGQGPLRVAVQGITDLVNSFNGLPDPGKQAVFWVGAVASAVTIAGGVFVIGIPKIAAYKIAVQQLGEGAQATSRALGTLGRAAAVGATIGAAAIGVDALSQAIAKRLLPSAEQIDNKMRNAKSGLEQFTVALQAQGVKGSHAAELLGLLGKQLDAVAASDFWHPADLSGTAISVANQLADIANSGDMATFSAQFRTLGDDANLTARQMRTFISANPDLQDALTKQATAAGLTADKQTLLKIALGQTKPKVDDNTDALRNLAGQAGSANNQVKGLEDTIKNFGKAQFDVNTATRAFEQAVDDLRASLTSNGKTLDVHTQKGRDNQAALDNVARSTLDLSSATYAQTQNLAAASAVIQHGRDDLIKQAEALGLTKAQAEKYADSLGLIPKNIASYVKLSGADQAELELQKLTRARSITIAVRTTGNPGALGTATGGNIARASGGIIPGAPSNRDNMLAAVASGEYVVRASQTSIPDNRRALEYINAGGVIRGYANGGFVQPQYASNVPWRGSSGASAPTFQNTQNIFPTPGMSEQTVGDIAAAKTAFAFRGL